MRIHYVNVNDNDDNNLSIAHGEPCAYSSSSSHCALLSLATSCAVCRRPRRTSRKHRARSIPVRLHGPAWQEASGSSNIGLNWSHQAAQAPDNNGGTSDWRDSHDVEQANAQCEHGITHAQGAVDQTLLSQHRLRGCDSRARSHDYVRGGEEGDARGRQRHSDAGCGRASVGPHHQRLDQSCTSTLLQQSRIDSLVQSSDRFTQRRLETLACSLSGGEDRQNLPEQIQEDGSIGPLGRPCNAEGGRVHPAPSDAMAEAHLARLSSTAWHGSTWRLGAPAPTLARQSEAVNSLPRAGQIIACEKDRGSRAAQLANALDSAEADAWETEADSDDNIEMGQSRIQSFEIEVAITDTRIEVAKSVKSEGKNLQREPLVRSQSVESAALKTSSSFEVANTQFEVAKSSEERLQREQLVQQQLVESAAWKCASSSSFEVEQTEFEVAKSEKKLQRDLSTQKLWVATSGALGASDCELKNDVTNVSSADYRDVPERAAITVPNLRLEVAHTQVEIAKSEEQLQRTNIHFSTQELLVATSDDSLSLGASDCELRNDVTNVSPTDHQYDVPERAAIPVPNLRAYLNSQSKSAQHKCKSTVSNYRQKVSGNIGTIKQLETHKKSETNRTNIEIKHQYLRKKTCRATTGREAFSPAARSSDGRVAQDAHT